MSNTFTFLNDTRVIFLIYFFKVLAYITLYYTHMLVYEAVLICHTLIRRAIILFCIDWECYFIKTVFTMNFFLSACY